MSKELISCETQEGKNVSVEIGKLDMRISAYGILVKGDKVLVIQAHLPLWEFPGGGVHPGEPITTCLVREFREETGLEVTPERLLLERESFYFSPSQKAYHSFQHFFVVAQIGDSSIEPKTNRIGATWMSISRLCQQKMNPGAQTALEIYLAKKDHIEFLPLRET